MYDYSHPASLGASLTASLYTDCETSLHIGQSPEFTQVSSTFSRIWRNRRREGPLNKEETIYDASFFQVAELIQGGKARIFFKSQSLYVGGEFWIVPSFIAYIWARARNISKSQSLYVGQNLDFSKFRGHFPEYGTTRGGERGHTCEFLIVTRGLRTFPEYWRHWRGGGVYLGFSIVAGGSKIGGGLTKYMKHVKKGGIPIRLESDLRRHSPYD